MSITILNTTLKDYDRKYYLIEYYLIVLIIVNSIT